MDSINKLRAAAETLHRRREHDHARAVEDGHTALTKIALLAEHATGDQEALTKALEAIRELAVAELRPTTIGR